MATVADLKEETPEKKIQAEKEVTDGEFQHPNVTSSDDISETIDATVTDSNIIIKDTVAEETLHADHVKLPGEPKGEILCKTPELVKDSSEEAGQKETDLQETKIEMPKEKQACTLKDGVDKTYGLPVEAGQKDTSADVPVKIIIESNHDIILASQDIEHVKIAASSILSRDCQETEAVTTVESTKEEVQRSNVIEEILPSEDNRLKNGSIIDSELEKEGNVSDSMVNLKTMVTTEQKEYKSVVEEDSIVKTDDPSAIQHIERSQDDANKKDERDAYAVETVDEVRKNQIAIPSTPETKDNQVATPSEIIEIKVPQNSEIASNFQASIEDDQQKDQYVNDINDTAVETGASGEQMLDESYATKDVKVKADAECSNMKESASADKSGSTEAVSDEHFETSITTISIEKDLTDRGTSYSEDNFPKAVESNHGKTAAGDELKSKEDFDILLVSESAAGEKFQVERTQDLAEVASMKEKEKPEAVAEVSYIVIDEKEKTDEALPSTESTEEKTCQLNETSTLKNVDESSDQSSKTDKVLEDDRHFNDDQISVAGNLVKEVHPTNVEAEIQEADIKSPGIDESSEELSSNTQEVVPSSDLQLASEKTNFEQSSKGIAPIETKDEANTFASDFSREQTYESNKSPVDMMLDPKGEIEIAEAELLNKECRATTTSDTDIVTTDHTESLTCEVETSSLEKKNDNEERKTDIEHKGTWDEAHNVDGGPWVEEVHITNTDEIIQDGDMRLESVKEVDECIHGDQDNKLKDLTEEEEATHTSGDKLEDDIDASPSFTSKPLTETIDPEKEVEAIPESQEADIRSPGIEESTEELSNNTQEVVHSSDLKLASETTNSDQSSKDIAPIEAEDEEHTFALQSESTAPSSDFSREQTYQSNKAPVDMMLNKQCHATTTLDSDIETKDQTESLTCEVETSSFEKKDDHEEREIDIQLKGTCDDVQNVVGGPCEEEIHINNTKEIILDGATGLESVKQVDVKCTHGDQDMVKDGLKEVEESDRGSIEKSMYDEAFMEDNAFHFSPEKHEEDQFTSAHKAQDEAGKKELADYSSKQNNIVDEKVHDKEGVESENDPNSRTSTDNEEASRSITYGEKEGDTDKQIESLNPKPGDLPVVQTLFMKSLDFDDQKNDEGVEDPKTSRVEEVLNIGDHSTVEDPKEDLENKNVQEILHERDEKETVQTSLDFLVEKEGKNLLGVKVPIKGDMEQPTSMESREPAERVGTGTITKEEFTEFFAVEGMSEIKGRCPQAMEKDSLNEIDTTKTEGLKVQEFGIAREHSRIESEKVELRKENGNNGNGVGNDDNSKMQEEPEEGKPTDEKIDKKVDEKMQNQTERDAQSAGMLHADIVEEYSVIDDLNSSEQNVNSVDSVKCKEETKDVEEQHKNMVAVPAFLLSATKEKFEEKEKPEAAFCAATPSTEGEIIEKEKREAEVATTELFNTIPTTNNGTSNEKGQRMNVFEGEEKKSSDDSTIAKDMIFEEGGCDLKKSLFMDRNETDNDKGDMVEIKMTHEQDLAPLVTAQSNSEVLDCNKLNTAEEKDEGTSKNLSSLSTTEPIEGTICKDRGQDVPEDTSLVHNDKADPSKFMKEDESTVLMASQPIITEGLLPAEEKVPTPKEEDACTVDNYLPVSQFLLNLIHEEFPDDENTKADNLKQEGIVPKDYIKTETRTEEDNRDSMELPANNSSLMLEEKKHDFCERPEDGNAEGMEELKKLSNSPNEREIDKDTNDDNFFLSESAESRHGDLKILNDEAKEELTIVSESGIEEDVSSTHPSYDEKVYEQKTPKEHAIESCLDKNIDVQEVDSKDEEILKQESNDSEDKIESQLDNEMINEAGLENKASVVIQPEEIKELEDSINNKGTLPNTQGVEQTKVSHSEIYVDDLQVRSTDTVEKIKEEVAEDQTTKMETLSPDEKEPYKNLDAVEQKNPSENFIIFVDPKEEVQSNVETVDKAMEDQKAFSAIKSAEVKCAESLVAREIEEVLPEVKMLPVTELAEATDPECIPTGKIVERDTDKKSTATTDEECLTTSEIVEKVKEEDETSTTVKSGVKDAEHFNGSEETAQSNQFQVAEVLGYIVVQGQKQGEIFENESEFVEETEKEEKAQMNINIKESSSGDLKESYLSMENQTDMQKRAVEDKNQNAESYLERKEIKDSTVKEEKIEEAKNESSGQNVTEESGHETAPLIEMKEGKHSPSNKKHGNILSGVRSKVKHSISSVKKAITCSSSVSHLIHEGN